MAPMTMSLPSRADALELADAAEIDQMLRRGQAKLHHGDQAVAAGERPGVVAEIGQQADRLGDGFRAMIGEGAWYHGILLACASVRPTSPDSVPRAAQHRLRF